MNILVVGNGGREHALAWKLAQSPHTDKLFVAPGNGGTRQVAVNLDIAATDIDRLLTAVEKHGVDLTVVGPEAPLAEGLVDRFAGLGLRVFGPTKGAARLESSKIFAREVMSRAGVPCANGRDFSSAEEANGYLDEVGAPVVVKADGLAAGKGVTVASTLEEAHQAVEEAMVGRVFGEAGERVIIEECLGGREVSLFVFTDGMAVSGPVTACDYKRQLDGDRGPNTGGMGCYSPAEFLTETQERELRDTITLPIIRTMSKMGCPYKGVLYTGLMMTEDGPRVLEFNVRLGDPEAQVVLPRLESDLVEIIDAVVSDRLSEVEVKWSPESMMCVVLASGGYPGKYETGQTISGLDSLESEALVFHAGTFYDFESEKLVTSGGRVLSVGGRALSLEEARERVYENVGKVGFEGAQYRKDIGLVGEAVTTGD